MFDYTTLQFAEKQLKDSTVQAIDFGQKIYTESVELFDKNTNGMFNIYTVKAAEAVNNFIETVRTTVEKSEITNLLRGGVKK
jgi:hypothetical protein